MCTNPGAATRITMDISATCVFIFVSFLLSSFLVLTASKSRRRSGGSATLPPGPRRIPIIGNILQVGKIPHRSLADLSKTYGPIMSLKLGNLTTVVVASPETAKEVLQTYDQVLSARTCSDSVRAICHHDVSIVWLPPTSTLWRHLRKISVAKLFSPHRLEAMKSVRTKKVQELLDSISQSSGRGEEVNIARASFVTSLNIISNALFSVDFGSYDSEASNEYHDIVVRLMEAIGKPDISNFFPALGFLDLKGSRKETKACTDKLFQVFQRFIDARTKERLSQREPKDDSNTDFLDTLLDHSQENESELSTEVIKHFLLDLFGAGTDTNSSTVEWAMAELLRNPNKMAKAQTEIRQLLGENGVVEESDISKLPYLQAVVKETFRLHPAAPFLIPRGAVSDAQLFGFLVPKNAQIWVNVWAIGRDPSVWKNPTRFKPERFMGRNVDVKGRDFELTPFGSGRRICPGMPLAIKIVPFVLASLLHSFDWKLPKGIVPEDLDMSEAFGLTLHKAKPLCAFPIKRHDASTSSMEI